MDDSRSHADLSELILRKLDDSITDRERLELFSRLEADPQAIDAYVELTLLYSCLLKKNRNVDIPGETEFVSREEYSQVLKAMAEHEDHALPQEVEPQIKKPEIVTPTVKMPISTGKRQVNKANLVMAIVSLAALLLMIAYVNLVPVATQENVAVLTDSMNAKWANTELPVDIDSSLSNADGVRNLLRGCIKLKFFSGAEVVIEGPAEFELKTLETMTLNSGRLFANVPKQAIGFTVDTPCSSVVDLGTQFGLKVDFDGTSDLHMFKGRASISVGDGRWGKSSRQAVGGEALRVDPSQDQIKDIPVRRQMFVRQISSDGNLIWRGESLDLANLASGGDGFSTWGAVASIDPRNGESTEREHVDRETSNAYVPVLWNPYVDGVFVPNGAQPQFVTSQDHLFEECPATNSVFCDDITVNQDLMDKKTTVVLRGVQYGFPDHPAIFMHANLGITFDLASIRELLPEGTDLVFSSEIGVSEEGIHNECNADFWVLVDGQIRYQKRNVKTRGPCDQIKLQLTQTDRFLTLITTDGGFPLDTPKLRQTDSDWCIFAEPQLNIE